MKRLLTLLYILAVSVLHAEKHPTIKGISEVTIVDISSIKLIDEPKSFHLCIPPSYKPQKSATLIVGESCMLYDRHASKKLTLKSISNEYITFKVVDTYDARSFGGEVTKKESEITIKPYKN